jgi:hypothetical protein
MVALLVMQLVVLRDSQQHIRDTDARIARVEQATRLAVDDARPGIREIGPTLQQARPLLRRARGLVGPMGTAIDSVTAAADRLPQLYRDVATLADLARSDEVRAGLDALPELRALPHVEELIVDLDRKAGRNVDIGNASLRTQQEALRIQNQLLAIAQETLAHTRSIDAKLGGELPTTPAGGR